MSIHSEKSHHRLSQIQIMTAYLGGSVFQTIVDNPVTAYRQLVQQYAKNTQGQIVSTSIAKQEAIKVFRRFPISASMSGLTPRLIGVGLKRIPKFTSFLGFSYFMKENNGPSLLSATFASIVSAPFINPIRMIEKQQRAYFRQSGKEKSIIEIIKESSEKQYKPLFRGTIPLMGHSLASATTGLVGQPRLQKYIEEQLGNTTNLSTVFTNLIASCIVSPIYVILTNPLSRLEVIMQTSSIKGKSINLGEALKELSLDIKLNGISGLLRGQGLGMTKAVISLTSFHLGRIWIMDFIKYIN